LRKVVPAVAALLVIFALALVVLLIPRSGLGSRANADISMIRRQSPMWVAFVSSWYGQESGRRTASGELFLWQSEYSFAAWDDILKQVWSRQSAKLRKLWPGGLEFGTKWEIRSVDTGRCIIAKWNDRGPARRLLASRQIDLSWRAAADLSNEAVNLPVKGLFRIEIRLAEPGEQVCRTSEGGWDARVPN